MVMGLLNKDIKIKLGAEKDCVQKVSVEIPAAKVKEKIEAAFVKVQSKAKMPGFRPGKAPMDVIKKSFSANAYAEAQDILLREGVSEAIQSKNLQAVEAPVVQSVNFTPDKPFSFEFTVVVVPTFKLGSYKGLKITKKKRQVKKEDVEKRLKEIADANAKLLESKSETVDGTHFVNINYEGFLDGKPIEGTKAENFMFDMTAKQSIAGLSDGMKGMKVDEEKDIKVEFPKDSPIKHLAGKEANFKVKVLSIKEKKVPNLDDEFAKDLGFKSMAEVNGKIQETMEKEHEQTGRRELETQIIDKLVEGHKFSVPKTLIDKQTDSLLNRQRYRLMQQGIPKEDQEKILEGLKPETTKQAEKEVRLAYILNAVGEQEKLSVTEDELKKKIEQLIEQAGPQEKKAMEQALNGQYKEQVRSELKDTKLFDFLIENAKIKES